jgi:excinuclease UvrABC ATPase subunit
VGWNPEEKYPYISGFSNEKGAITQNMVNVGCENCHGPGENHVIAEKVTTESTSNTAEKERYRAAMRMTTDEKGQRFCYSCHDLDNSPNFDFDTYWDKIKHKVEQLE